MFPWTSPGAAAFCRLQDHQRFLGAVETLVRSKMDSVAFEDQMRPLLGARAYVTFTLDKLLQRLVKQMQNVAADPLVPRVMALRRYEDAKAPKSEGAPPPPRSLLDLATYQLDAQVLLQEEACFRVDVEEGGAGPNGGTRIHASLMDPTIARADTYINMVNPEFKVPDLPSHPHHISRVPDHSHSPCAQLRKLFTVAGSLQDVHPTREHPTA